MSALGQAGGGLEEAGRALVEAERVLVLTGAGASAESGVPTFRGEEGLWQSHRPEELATPQAFAADPRLVWSWYAWRRERITRCAPGAAHRALASFAATRPGVRIVTQNVDGLHEASWPDRARSYEEAHLELHGSVFRVRCTGCGQRCAHREPIDASDAGSLPRCADCGALLRPDVVWFGEGLDPDVLGAARQHAAGSDVALVVGTSAVVEPAASLPRLTRDAGGLLIEVNPEETPLSPLARWRFSRAAGTVLPDLLRAEVS